MDFARRSFERRTSSSSDSRRHSSGSAWKPSESEPRSFLHLDHEWRAMKWRAVALVVVVVVFAGGFAGYRVGHKPPEGRCVCGPTLVATRLIPKGTPGSI